MARYGMAGLPFFWLIKKVYGVEWDNDSSFANWKYLYFFTIIHILSWLVCCWKIAIRSGASNPVISVWHSRFASWSILFFKTVHGIPSAKVHHCSVETNLPSLNSWLYGNLRNQIWWSMNGWCTYLPIKNCDFHRYVCLPTGYPKDHRDPGILIVHDSYGSMRWTTWGQKHNPPNARCDATGGPSNLKAKFGGVLKAMVAKRQRIGDKTMVNLISNIIRWLIWCNYHKPPSNLD